LMKLPTRCYNVLQYTIIGKLIYQIGMADYYLFWYPLQLNLVLYGKTLAYFECFAFLLKN